ncbi:MAG: response regulator [Clostridiales bacterium]|jgi:CheY-like chemotaxis protein|nr:response regulator [Clostridiales bacterium]
MYNILIISEVRDFLFMSVKEQMLAASFKVSAVPADTDAINGFKEPVDGILIYTDEKLVKQQQALNFLKDKAVMDDIPIFALGCEEDLKAVKVIISANILRQEFLRPLTAQVSELVEKIDNSIKTYNMQKKILVVDDSGVTLRNVKGYLGEKYNVFLANSGTMAIKYLTLNRPDLILLDYAMPVADGKQVLEMIRTEPEFADIPVIFLTNRDDKESILSLKDFKLEGYLLKSMTPGQIIKAVDDFFERRKAQM